MKFAIACLSMICIASCGDARNERMTELVNRQKTLKDSIDYYHNAESYYYGKAKEAMSNPDSTKWKALADSSSNASILGMKRKKDLQQVEFSIDSLVKMK